MADEIPQPTSRIRILDEETINKIAAGEVVDRPASIIKELVENAVDAGAGSIRVEVNSDGHGVRMIRITDDGCGMTHEEAILAFERHATSKIQDAEDLMSVRTMGFRGEALASIAAVSKVTMVTMRRGAGERAAIRIVIAGGIIMEEAETAAPPGTSIVIQDLFYNTPARRKFQKSPRTEMTHIYRTMEELMLAHTGIAFRFVHNSNERMASLKGASMQEVIAGIFGTDLAGRLIRIDARTPWLSISGFIAPPDENRPNSRQIHLAVNQRQITAPVLFHAVRTGYGELMPKDRYPVAFLSLTIDTVLVDVNVHPAKREVRFSREGELVRELSDAIRNSLSEWVTNTSGFVPAAHTRHGYEEFPAKSPKDWAVRANGQQYHADLSHRTVLGTESQLRMSEHAGGTDEIGDEILPEIRILGQIDNTYIIASRPDAPGLIIIDQHAAHERILFDKLVAKREHDSNVQELLVPVVLSLRPAEAEAVKGARHLLMQEGFILEDFGENTFAVRTVPVVLGKQQKEQLVRDIISEIVGSPLSESGEKRRDAVTAIIACRTAVKAGTPLSREQMERLVAQLRRTALPMTCPHGRPTIIHLDHNRLDRMFLRK